MIRSRTKTKPLNDGSVAASPLHIKERVDSEKATILSNNKREETTFSDLSSVQEVQKLTPKSRKQFGFSWQLREVLFYTFFVALLSFYIVPNLNVRLNNLDAYSYVDAKTHDSFDTYDVRSFSPRKVVMNNLHHHVEAYYVKDFLDSYSHQVNLSSTDNLFHSFETSNILGDSKDDKDKERCVYMHEWQQTSFPSCNSMHELDLHPSEKNFIYINSGGQRATFRMSSPSFSWNGESDGTIALKTPKYKKDISKSRIEKQQLDALGMERLTASPYVTNVYGYCGTGVVTEYSEGGNLHDLIKSARMGGETLSSMDKLRVGVQIAQGVADMHTFEKDGIPSLAHHDVDCHQFIFVDGVYKLNDFEGAKLLKIDQFQGAGTKNATQICKRHTGSSVYKNTEPDKMLPSGYNPAEVDVYAMGNVMYYVLTNKYIMEEYSREEAIQRLWVGERSNYPESLLNCHPAECALIDAIEMCWAHDPLYRSSAKDVADFLTHKLRALAGGEDLSVVRVTVPPRNSGQRMTDSDYWEHV